jgi:hypothetical protein
MPRQPVHTFYEGAHFFRVNAPREIGDAALAALSEFAPSAESLARAIGVSPSPLFEEIHGRVLRRLGEEPVEDYRIDFEDGYGVRPDDEEDACAAEVARGVAAAHRAGAFFTFHGIRIKSLESRTAPRALRTLDVFLSTLAAEARGSLPPGFVVTLPKITSPDQPAALADALEGHENRLGLPPRSLGFEIMVETPESLFTPDGRVALRDLVRAARGRCTGAHLGTYDFTASLGIAPALQRMGHPACDFAKAVMQVSLAGTGVALSDGSTNLLPVGDRASVHAAWRLHYADVRRSLEGGFYQGWDLHPAQLPTRFAAVFGFFLEGKNAALPRLRAALDKGLAAAAAASAGGSGVLDDPATGQALLSFFLRGRNCGAFDESDAAEAGLSPGELALGSFAAILAGRRGR